jgi:hypothetical protein
MHRAAGQGQERTRLKRVGWIWPCLAFLLVWNGCGRKAPPIVPQQRPLVAVKDLKGVLEQGIVQLTWSHNPENRSATDYVVLRAQSDLSKPPCPGCPLIFQKEGAVRVGRLLREQQHTLAYSVKVMAGFRYTFDVRPVQSSGAQGPDSNLVVIAYAP